MKDFIFNSDWVRKITTIIIAISIPLIIVIPIALIEILAKIFIKN